jgi:hypothetical protein
MSEDIERTLCQLPQVHVFKIPVRKTAEGHRASDWPKEPTWTGKLRIVARGKMAAIILLDDKNQVFAVCQVNDERAVERTLDSGRYYVLRITNNQGKHAFIGIAFNERNDAFDFNVTLAEFKNEVERENQAILMSDSSVCPTKDLSLKEGEKIKIKFSMKKPSAIDEENVPSTTFISSSKPKSGGGSILLPPPRGGLGVFPSKTAIENVDSWALSSDPFKSTNDVQNMENTISDPFSSSFCSDEHTTANSRTNILLQTVKPMSNGVQEENLLDV